MLLLGASAVRAGEAEVVDESAYSSHCRQQLYWMGRSLLDQPQAAWIEWEAVMRRWTWSAEAAVSPDDAPRRA